MAGYEGVSGGVQWYSTSEEKKGIEALYRIRSSTGGAKSNAPIYIGARHFIKSSYVSDVILARLTKSY